MDEGHVEEVRVGLGGFRALVGEAVLIVVTVVGVHLVLGELA